MLFFFAIPSFFLFRKFARVKARANFRTHELVRAFPNTHISNTRAYMCHSPAFLRPLFNFTRSWSSLSPPPPPTHHRNQYQVMFISKASAVLAAALFFLDFPAMAANGVAQKADKATLLKIKQPLRNQIRGLVFSFYVNYAALDGPLELYANTTDFKAAFYDKPIYAEASNSSEVLGNAL